MTNRTETPATANYPTADDIEITSRTLAMLHDTIDQNQLACRLTALTLRSAVLILDALDDIPGLHYPYPEPEPQPTAAEVLKFAYACTESRTPEQGIMYAAKRYAEAHPAWFANWHERLPVSALIHAAHCARDAGDSIGHSALLTASVVATNHPELFGGAA